MPAYVGGLVLVYLAQRVIVTWEHVSLVLSVVGVLAALAATVARFLPQARGGGAGAGERASIDRLLGLLSVLGLVGVGLYFITTATGQDWFGISKLGVKSRERVETLILIAWVTLVAVALIPMLFAETALLSMRRSVQIESRRVKAAAASGLALALATAYCSLFVFAAGESKARVDYSYFKTSEPGSSTRKMVESFTEPLKITAFFPEVSDVRSEVATYLTELVKGVPNVELSIVDRYLEHSRIFFFANGGNERCYLSSGDWMTRNLDHRVEVAIPVHDAAVRAELRYYFNLQLRDTSKARVINEAQDNQYRRGARNHRAQVDIYRWLARASGRRGMDA